MSRYDEETQKNMKAGHIYSDNDISKEKDAAKRESMNRSNEAVRQYMELGDNIKDLAEPIKKLAEEVQELKKGIKIDTSDKAQNQNLAIDISGALDKLKTTDNSGISDAVKSLSTEIGKINSSVNDMSKTLITTIIKNGKQFEKAIKYNKKDDKKSDKGDKK